MIINPISPVSLAEHVIERFIHSFYLTPDKTRVQDEGRVLITESDASVQPSQDQKTKLLLPSQSQDRLFAA